MSQQEHIDQQRVEFRLQVLRQLGAGLEESHALLAYNANPFHAPAQEVVLPPPDEPFVAAWREYAGLVQRTGTLRSLEKYLPHLRFPVEAGISQTAAYQRATLHGLPPAPDETWPGLGLAAPEQCEVEIYPSHAGAIATVTAAVRDDFVRLVQAFGRKNEPEPIPLSMGALMISGYRNWDRVHRLRAAHDPATATRLLQDRFSYQDRFILLSREFYSGVRPEQIGLDEAEWRQASWYLRREHEVTHYFCRRILGAMRNNLFDEMMADYAGIVCACGRFRSDWLLLFLGLERFPRYRPGARLENYRGSPPLDDRGFELLQRLVYRAAVALEQFDGGLRTAGARPDEWPIAITAISTLSLEELASTRALPLLHEAWSRAHSLLKFQPQQAEVLS
jgi:hypothetical protein